jgi:hypothetical protein
LSAEICICLTAAGMAASFRLTLTVLKPAFITLANIAPPTKPLAPVIKIVGLVIYSVCCWRRALLKRALLY